MHGDAREVARSALELHTEGEGFHTVLSDMCHDTMGADVADVGASLDLCECAAKIALGAGFAGPLPDLPDLPVRSCELLGSKHPSAIFCAVSVLRM